MKKPTGKKADAADASEEDPYRQLLVELEQKALASYDKTLITLSGGALAVSIAFLKDVLSAASPVCPRLAALAWGLWCASLTFTLISLYSGALALRRAIEQVDSGQVDAPLGGAFDKLTATLNTLSGAAFVVGTGCFVYFVYLNLSVR